MTLLSAAVVLHGAVLTSVLVALFLYGANGYLLLLERRRWRPPRPDVPAAWPAVTIQLPVYNERDVVARAVEAAGRLRYPGKLDLQLLDDSDDDTVERAARAIERLRAAGFDARHVRRDGRAGYKAGALAHGLHRSSAELLLVLDADFVPPPDFLLRAVPLLRDPRAGCIQGRWGHLNAEESALTRAQALVIDVHFAVEQRARSAAGWPVAFNGSVGLWRRAALEDAGGWSDDTLTEDLDLSYRAWLRGWQVLYADALECPGEVPESITAFRAQQRRWAQGSTATARKLLGAIWRSPASPGSKLQATLHLTHYAVHPLMVLSILLSVPLGFLGARGAAWAPLFPLALATGGPLAMAVAAAAERRSPWGRRLRDLSTMSLLGTGLMLSNGLAVLAGLRGGARAPFRRTPKGGARSSYRMPFDPLCLLELGAAAACLALGAWLLSRGVVAMAPFLLLYACGLTRIGGGSMMEALSARPASPAGAGAAAAPAPAVEA